MIWNSITNIKSHRAEGEETERNIHIQHKQKYIAEQKSDLVSEVGQQINAVTGSMLPLERSSEQEREERERSIKLQEKTI